MAGLAGVVAKCGLSDEEASGVEVGGYLGEGVAFFTEGGDLRDEEVDGFADGEGIGKWGGEGIEVLADLLDGFGSDGGGLLFAGHIELFERPTKDGAGRAAQSLCIILLPRNQYDTS